MRTTFMICAALIASTAHAQTPPPIQWQHRYGGSGIDMGYRITPTSDGGHIASCSTSSNDGDVIGLHGMSTDLWTVKLGPLGDIQWSLCHGGSASDITHTVVESTQGGFFLAGTVQSDDGDVTCDMGLGAKFWIAHLASDGESLWDLCPLGSPTNNYMAIAPAHGGGWLVCARTFDMQSGDGCGMGGGDVWLAHLDETGQVLWGRCIGGSADDRINNIMPTDDGGYILAGGTRSNDGVVAGMNPYPGGNHTAWLLKLDAQGDIQWQRLWGGTGWEQLFSVAEDPNGALWALGYTTSSDGHIEGHHGGEDIWVIRTDPEGVLVNQRCLGGSDDDWALELHLLPNGHALIAGPTKSTDGDVVGHQGGSDAWVVELTPSLDIVWQKTFGGSGTDYLYGISSTQDGGIVLIGWSHSLDGDLADLPPLGLADVWILKLAPWDHTAVEEEPQAADFLLFPNPTTGDLQLDFGPLQGPDWQLEIVDALGRMVHTVPNIHATQGRLTLNTNGLAQGTYAVRLHRAGESHVRRFIKQ